MLHGIQQIRFGNKQETPRKPKLDKETTLAAMASDKPWPPELLVKTMRARGTRHAGLGIPKTMSRALGLKGRAFLAFIDNIAASIANKSTGLGLALRNSESEVQRLMDIRRIEGSAGASREDVFNAGKLGLYGEERKGKGLLLLNPSCGTSSTDCLLFSEPETYRSLYLLKRTKDPDVLMMVIDRAISGAPIELSFADLRLKNAAATTAASLWLRGKKAKNAAPVLLANPEAGWVLMPFITPESKLRPNNYSGAPITDLLQQHQIPHSPQDVKRSTGWIRGPWNREFVVDLDTIGMPYSPAK